MINQPAPAVQSEKPSFAVAEAPVQQPSAAVDGASDVDFGLIAGALILLVVMSGTIIVLNRRGSSTQGRSVRGAEPGDEMPWTHPAAAGNAPAVRRRDRSEVIDEIEQLLAAGRPPRPSH
jgi:hypothetical protein